MLYEAVPRRVKRSQKKDEGFSAAFRRRQKPSVCDRAQLRPLSPIIGLQWKQAPVRKRLKSSFCDVAYTRSGPAGYEPVLCASEKACDTRTDGADGTAVLISESIMMLCLRQVMSANRAFLNIISV